MALRVRSIKHYYVTEISWELPANLGEIDDLIRSTGSTAETIGMYNDGGVLGFSTKQRTKIASADDNKKICVLLGIKGIEI